MLPNDKGLLREDLQVHTLDLLTYLNQLPEGLSVIQFQKQELLEKRPRLCVGYFMQFDAVRIQEMTKNTCELQIF